jgi:hypothetical protein
MDKAAWQAKREAEGEAETGERAALFEGWSRPRRFLVSLALGLLTSSVGVALVALLWTRDTTGALVGAAVLAVLLATFVVWFTVAPGHLLRAITRSQTSSTDPAESPPWTIPG